MQLDQFDYSLPKELIAQYPADQRDHSRLMVLPQNGGDLIHSNFHQLAQWLHPGDVLIVNDSKVTAFRLDGQKVSSNIQVHCLFTDRITRTPPVFEVIAKPLRRLKSGTKLQFAPDLLGTVLSRAESTCQIELSPMQPGGSVPDLIKKYARPALPPYISRQSTRPEVTHQDWDRYQTVYARQGGSIAAPTAGLHFTPEVLTYLEQQGVLIKALDLKIGQGTFRPIRVNTIEEHVMESEYYEISSEIWDLILQTQLQGNRLYAVGTTVVRALESAVQDGNLEDPKLRGHSDLFIYPGYRFQLKYAGLITNFHLPKSTLFLLVSAWAGRKKMLQAYTTAIKERYRFYSYGDAMLIHQSGLCQECK